MSVFNAGDVVRCVNKAFDTVIAIGEWHLVRLRPYAPGVPAAWEFLPVPENVQRSLKHSGQKDQCVYGDEWVRAEIDQEGGFRIISEPTAVTAKRVLDAVARGMDAAHWSTSTIIVDRVWADVSKEFGVTS